MNLVTRLFYICYKSANRGGEIWHAQKVSRILEQPDLQGYDARPFHEAGSPEGEVKMNIFVMRHGQAVSQASTDALRPLTEHGEEEVCHMAQWLAQQVASFDRVLVSPYVRSRQTWQQVSRFIPGTRIDFCDELIPNADADITASLILAYADVEQSQNLLVISHMPLVGFLVESLCPATMAPIFVTSGVAKITLEKGHGGLFNWLEGPHSIRPHRPRPWPLCGSMG
ncbi:phosphohistidine phosphatase SixA [Oceanimonas smirnovii]|uniref:phosphohistidine phosphatase SixA n=1 Tax=Oceanimonas smirnovii TaxID=264574 RepID=UPI003AACF51A